MGLDMQRPFYL